MDPVTTSLLTKLGRFAVKCAPAFVGCVGAIAVTGLTVMGLRWWDNRKTAAPAPAPTAPPAGPMRAAA